MSIEAVTWALSADTGSATRKLVLIGIANHAHKDGRNAWPSRATVAEYANCDPKTVGRHVKELIRDGWIRRGDQRHVDHLPHYVRPVVYDVAMTEAQRLAWQAETASDVPEEEPLDEVTEGTSEPAPGDSLSPGPPDNLSPGTDWDQGTPETPPRDTAVSHKPSLNQLPPLPPASGGRPCAKPGPTPHPNCRGCGTTNRQRARDAERAAAEQRRRAEQERLEAERARQAAQARPAREAAQHLAEARRRLAGARGGAPR